MDDTGSSRRVHLSPVALDALPAHAAVSRIVGLALARDRARQACAVDIDALFAARRDEELARVYTRADLVVAEGAALVWASRLLGARLAESAVGIEIFWGLAAASASLGLRLFFLGAPVGVPARAARAVERQVRGARVIGTYAPRVDRLATQSECARVCDVVRAAAPDVLLVALGGAGEDKWIDRHKEALGVPVSLGARASLAIAAGDATGHGSWLHVVRELARVVLFQGASAQQRKPVE